MTETHHTKHNNSFGSSFFWGVAVGAAGLYLLGTKNGRNIVKKMMDSVEQLENSAEDIFDILEEKAKDDFNVENLAEAIHDKKEETHIPTSNLHSVMEKIRSSIPLREVKDNHKYISRDGRIIK
ncbi:MAG TPA: hypothetical protein VK338_01160 [Candidatus Nitrosocosmicus sp.]|nr:hypothetical protein [Candidatus Nitrosocosmicus sp.]